MAELAGHALHFRFDRRAYLRTPLAMPTSFDTGMGNMTTQAVQGRTIFSVHASSPFPFFDSAR